jgi:hypothetical protein
MKKVLDAIMLYIGGFGIGYFASEYSWWILLLAIPYLYFSVNYHIIKVDYGKENR